MRRRRGRSAVTRTPRWRQRICVLVTAGLSLCAAGCSSGPSSTSSSTTSESDPVGSSTTLPPAAPVYEVQTGYVKGLGTVLVDGQGFTLYLFVPDKASGQSSCYGACAQGWPPLLLPAGVSTPLAAGGARQSLLGTTVRSDGSHQVTYNRWPLYTWVSDSVPGQATGQALNNLGGLWFVLSASGAEIRTKLRAP